MMDFFEIGVMKRHVDRRTMAPSAPGDRNEWSIAQ
jgi:hypothetical protein